MSKSSQQTSETMDLVSASSLGAYGAADDILKNNTEDVNKVNASGWTPVMYAANYGHFNVIRLLIRYGCYVDYRDWQGRTALMLAASNGHTRCLDVLINYGKADKNCKDLSGNDAYKYAKNCGHGNNKLIKNLLFKSEGYELKGRPFNAPTPAPSPVNMLRSCAVTPNKSPKDEIYNPYQKNAFSSLSAFMRSSKTILKQLKEDFQSNGSNESLASTEYSSTQDLTLACSSSTESSMLSSSCSSAQSASEMSVKCQSAIISAPKPRRKSIGSRKKSSVECITSPMPKSLFHLFTRVDLIQYLDLFEENDIDFYQFLTLTDADFQRLGITSYGHRKKLAIAQMRYHESLDINSTQESFFADYLLNERNDLNNKVKELEEKLNNLLATNTNTN